MRAKSSTRAPASCRKTAGLERTLAAADHQDVLVPELPEVALLRCVGHQGCGKSLERFRPIGKGLDARCHHNSPCEERFSVFERELVPDWSQLESQYLTPIGPRAYLLMDPVPISDEVLQRDRI